MNIDWFTFGAQIANFLLLVVLLHRFLYGPIVRAMQEREDNIAARLAQAEHDHAAAMRQSEKYDEKLREIDEQRDELLHNARREVHEERQHLLEQAKADVARKRSEWEETLRHEQEDLMLELRSDAGHMGLEAARQTLAQLAGADLEEQMVESFSRKIRELDQQKRTEIDSRLNNGEADVSFRSAFDLSPERRDQLRSVIRDTFDYDSEISFEKVDDLICGLEFDIGGYSFGWNAKDLLQNVEREFDRRVRWSQ